MDKIEICLTCDTPACVLDTEEICKRLPCESISTLLHAKSKRSLASKKYYEKNRNDILKRKKELQNTPERKLAQKQRLKNYYLKHKDRLNKQRTERRRKQNNNAKQHYI